MIVGPDSDLWRDVLGRLPHDYCHEGAYVQLEADRLGGSPMGYHAVLGDAEAFLPLILRVIPGTERLDAISPYGYPGPLFLNAATGDIQQELMRVILAGLAAQGVVTAFVRLHPILNDGLATVPRGTLIHHGQTVVIDVTQPIEELWRQTRRDHRSHIKRGDRAGYRAHFDDDWQHLADFATLYRETMQRVGATPEYLFRDEYFAELSKTMGRFLRLCVIEIDGVVAGAAIFSICDGIVGYHLSGTDSRSSRIAPTKLILQFVREWAHDVGAAWFLLGGGLGAQGDSLYEFKAGFGPLRRSFSTWRVVLDAPTYEDLGGSTSDLDGFFPAYRRALGSEDGDPTLTG